MGRRWSINGRFLGQPLTGVQRYGERIVLGLDAWLAQGHPLARGLEIDIIVPQGDMRALPLEKIAVRRAAGASGQLWEQTVLPGASAQRGLLNLCNTGPISVRKQIVCMHDVNARLCPHSYSRQFRMLYRILMPALGRVATEVATVSRFSAEQIAQFGIAPAERIHVMPDGFEHALEWQPRHTSATAAAASPRTVVLLGSLAPHKNIGLVLGLAARLAQRGIRLAVVGDANARVFAADGAGMSGGSDIAWLGRLSDEALAALLCDSLCLAFPSLTEGFGLPPLEAMAMGVPVIVSDAASLPEICGEAALYCPPRDSEAWLEQIVRLAGDSRLRARLAAAGMAQARKFSWRRSSELYLEAMARIDGVVMARQSAAAGASA